MIGMRPPDGRLGAIAAIAPQAQHQRYAVPATKDERHRQGRRECRQLVVVKHMRDNIHDAGDRHR